MMRLDVMKLILAQIISIQDKTVGITRFDVRHNK